MSLITDFLDELDTKENEIKAHFDNEELVFVYRGESKDYGTTKMMPSIFRNNSANNINAIEMKVLESITDFGVSTSSNNSLFKAIDTQHYIAYSRLLDVTFNSLVALFFSLDYDTRIPESSEEADVYIIGIPKKFVFSQNSKYLNECYEDLINPNVETFFHDNIKLISQGNSNDRIAAQDGGFILFHGNHFTPINDFYHKRVTIDKNKRDSYLSVLENRFNITKSKIYPEKHYKGLRIGLEVNSREYYHFGSPLLEFELSIEKMMIELKKSKKDAIAKKDRIDLERLKRYYKSTFRKRVDLYKKSSRIRLINTEFYKQNLDTLDDLVSSFERRLKSI